MEIFTVEYKKKSVRDNNPKGVIPLPTYDTDPSNQRRRMKGKLNFGALYGRGESPRDDGQINVVTANGISRSYGGGMNEQYNADGIDGEWNQNRGWSGGNRTGE